MAGNVQVRVQGSEATLSALQGPDSKRNGGFLICKRAPPCSRAPQAVVQLLYSGLAPLDNTLEATRSFVEQHTM